MESNRGQRIVVMGATNRPWMVDEAVLRRFSTQYEIGLPTAAQRLAILRGYLARHHSEMGDQGVSDELMMDAPDAGTQGVGAVSWIAVNTEGFSGSDLVELCSNAAQRVLSEYWTEQRHAAQSRGEEPSTLTASDVGEVRVRILTRLDFEEALKVTHPSVHKAEEYQAKGTSGSNLSVPDFLNLIMKMAGNGAS